MGWRPQPRFDKSRNSWFCRYKNRKHYLGTDMTEAYRKFADIVGNNGEPPVTVTEAIDRWLRNNGGTWEWGELKAWDQFAGETPLHRLGDDHLTDFACHLGKRDLSAWTIRHRVRLASAVLRWCVQKKYLDAMPTKPKLPKPMRRPRDVPLDKLVKAFQELPERAGRVLRFILETGCRPSEACRLQWSQVDQERGMCILTTHKTGRTGRPRTIYLTPAAADILKEQPRRYDHVFVSRLGKPYTAPGLRSILRRRGIASVYSLRHTAAQRMLDAQVSLEDIAKLLGHSDLATVGAYAQVRDERAREVASNLASVLPPPSVARSSRRTSRGKAGGRSVAPRKGRKSARARAV